MEEKKDNALIIFLKNPEEGYVKTRLASQIGDAEALSVYHQLLEHTRNVALECGADLHLFYSDFIDEEDKWPGTDFTKHRQMGNTLGEKMLNAFETIAEQGYEKMVIIGSDCPEITPRIINDAFSRLNEYDVVIGPAMDGGYYLLGMNVVYEQLFGGIDWSSEHVFDQTIYVMQQEGIIWYEMPILSDVDTEDDLPKMRKISGQAKVSE